VASVFLLVGGIGIMNIMLVSVTERTREIGVRMAVGGKSRHILMQVLLEAVALSTIGGVLGVVCGVVGARLLSVLAGWATLLPSEAMVIAVVFSAAVGIFFGFYPARKLPASILFRRSGTNKAGNSTGLWQRRPPGHDTEAVLQGTLHCPVARRRHRHQRYRKNERSQRYFLTAVRSAGMQQG
jgi:predicted lysophospholipase L1 biosynthesis ABC-type transport system permease subunit